MKKKLLWTLCVLLALILGATLIGPSIVLKAARQPEVEEGYRYSDAFLSDYDSVREHLDQLMAKLNAQNHSYAVDEAQGLYIDSYYLPSAGENTNLVVLTTGVHGMEGYIGAAMLDVFFGEIYPNLDRDTTGILVVANVNPYGMKNYRR